MPFGNVNVSYTPCRSVAQLKYAANYMLGRNRDQIKNGVVKTAPNLYMALGCNRENFANNVLVTRKLNGQKSTKNAILAHKMSISFHPDDKVDYITAYQIARDFAEKFAHDKGYEVLFAVHTDTDHVHAHFLISNCNMENGLSYRRNQRDLYEMSEYFGEQCVKHGYLNSVREDFYNRNPEKVRDKKTFAEAQMKKRGAESFKDELREVIQIELADSRNLTFEDVIQALKNHYNVECRVAGNTISYRHPEYLDKNKKPVPVRGSKLGNLYTRKGLEYELTKKRTADRGTKPRADRTDPIADYGRITAELERFVDANRGLPRPNAGAGGGQVRNNAASNSDLRNVRNSKSLYGEHKVGADNNTERPERVQRKRSGRGR